MRRTPWTKCTNSKLAYLDIRLQVKWTYDDPLRGLLGTRPDKCCAGGSASTWYGWMARATGVMLDGAVGDS